MKPDETQWTDLPATSREAIKADNMRFYTGKLCPQGHDSPRWAVNSTCVICNREEGARRYKRLSAADPAHSRVKATKLRAKKQGVPFSEEAYREALAAAPEFCPVLGTKLTSHDRTLPSHAEIDRIVPGLGYIRGNLWAISKRANTIKNDATPEELRIVADAVERRITEGE